MKERIKFIIIALTVVVVGAVIIYNTPAFQRFLYPLEYEEYIWPAAYKYGIDPRLVAAIIYVESRFQPQARSHKQAIGLMQITPETGRWIAGRMGIKGYHDDMLLDPETNINFGIWYLRDLKQEFGDDLVLMLAAYNAGRGNVNRWLEQELVKPGKGVNGIPFAETKGYIIKVMDAYHRYKRLYRN